MPNLLHTFQIGAITCHVLGDGNPPISPEAIQRFVPVSLAEAEKAFNDIGIDMHTLRANYNSLLLQSGDQNLLVDAGFGKHRQPELGNLFAGLETLGITPDAIQNVLISHAHGDHIAGLLDAEGQCMFPKATIHINHVEYDFWMGSDRESVIDILNALGAQLKPFEVGIELLAGVTTVATYGHTAGHTALMIVSNGDKFMAAVDVLHMPVQFAHPEWSPSFDWDTSISVPTRQAVLHQLADENLLALFFHLPFPGLGRVEKTDDAFKWLPITTD